MPSRPPTFRSGQQAKKSDYDRRRSKEKPWRKLYKLAAWHRLRQRRLSINPLCELCEERGITKEADTVNHRIPHRGDEGLFFLHSNTQSLCKACHDGFVQKEERKQKIKNKT